MWHGAVGGFGKYHMYGAAGVLEHKEVHVTTSAKTHVKIMCPIFHLITS